MAFGRATELCGEFYRFDVCFVLVRRRGGALSIAQHNVTLIIAPGEQIRAL